MRTCRFPRGFTLVEIMIAVAIIGILSSVAIPEMGKASLRARAAERRTIMTAIAHALSDYMVTTSTATPAMASARNPAGTPTTYKRVFEQAPDGPAGPWTTLSRSLQVEGATYYSYQFILNPNGTWDGQTRARLDVYAFGDLDGDGAQSSKQVIYLGFGNAFSEVDEIPQAGAEDQGTF